MQMMVTIDTEEDDWGQYNQKNVTMSNIKEIVALQALFDKYAVRPTYLVTYAVATNPEATQILKRISADGRCEIGGHCHPWNTPPLDELRTPYNSMLCNLDPDLQLRKLHTLTRTIEERFGSAPVSFRTGRWGFSQEVAHNLIRCGQWIDANGRTCIAGQQREKVGGDCHLRANLSTSSGMRFVKYSLMASWLSFGAIDSVTFFTAGPG